MNSIVASRSSAERRVVREDWRALRSLRLNLLLIGTTAQTSEVIADLWPELPAPVIVREARDFRPELPVGTLILQDAADMPTAQQTALLAWLGRGANDTHLVTTARTSLFPKVEAGLFLDTLYYRINTITIDLSADV